MGGFSSCKNQNESGRDEEGLDSGVNFYPESSKENGYEDGTYCAEVEYYNSITGTQSIYNLDVEVEGGELTVIHFPNGGWLDDSHFIPEDITDGNCTFTTDRGYEYTVTLQGFGGCL